MPRRFRSVNFRSVNFRSVNFRSVNFRSVNFRSVNFRSVGFPNPTACGMRICNAPFGLLRPFGSKRLLRHRATNPKTEASGETFFSIIFLFSSILTQEEQYNFSAKRLLDQTFSLKF